MNKPGIGDRATPGYFGPAEVRLFGCYHEPRGEAVKSCGFVLCHPFGREYILSHRAFRHLAVRLSRAGFPVLRFDCFGCGDSMGDGTEGNVDRWIGDITLAIRELRAHSGVEEVYLAGFRLGATLAALHGIREENLEGLVIWDPVTNGASYLEELIESHNRWLTLQFWRPKAVAGADRPAEILGFPLTAVMEQGLAGIDLLGLAKPPAARVLFLVSSDKINPDGFLRRLQNLGVAVDRRDVPWPEFWEDIPDLQDVLMPPVRVLQAVVQWASEVCA